MAFFRSLTTFVSRKTAREDIKRYVKMEYRPDEREFAYDRLVRKYDL